MTAKFATFAAAGKTRYGMVVDKGIIDLSCRYSDRWRSLADVVSDGALTYLSDVAAGFAPDFSMIDVRFKIPVTKPEKIVCIGVNYPNRNEEYKDGQAALINPSLFVRFPRSFVGHNQPLVRPPESPQLDYEGEVVIVIGKAGRRISEAEALHHIAAISVCNEGTIRDWVRHARFNVTQGKNFDRTASIGPWLVPFTHEAQIADVRIETRVNGEVRQRDRTDRMIFSFRKIINYVSTFTTLVRGDVLVTGTPTGAGERFDPPAWLKPGDVVEVEVEGVGVLRNNIIDET